jgi:integrase
VLSFAVVEHLNVLKAGGPHVGNPLHRQFLEFQRVCLFRYLHPLPSKSNLNITSPLEDEISGEAQYWSRLEEGFFLGYRKIDQGDGTWIARLRENGKQHYHALGTFSEYDEAAKAARGWRKRREQGVTKDDVTVADACREYVKHLKAHKGDQSSKDAEGRFNRLVFDKAIGKIALEKLQTRDVRTWLNDQVADEDEDDDEDLRKSKDSANRNLASFKAALNLALRDCLVATDAGWKTITPFRGVRRRRERMLDEAERKALLKACPDDLKLLVKGLLLTAARPGELAKATVADFNQLHGTLTLNGKTGRRIVTLSTAARQFLTDQCKDKLPTATILATNYGKEWTKDDWKKPFKEAVKTAKLPPDIVMYHLRHTAISELIMGGMQTSLVAMLAGTSTAMIDQHCGHLQHNKTRDMPDRVAIL